MHVGDVIADSELMAGPGPVAVRTPLHTGAMPV